MEKEVCKICGTRVILGCCMNDECITNKKITKELYENNKFDNNEHSELN